METETAARHKEVSFRFEQNNYSPEALSDLEIYRQTRNQLSQVKDALGLNLGSAWALWGTVLHVPRLRRALLESLYSRRRSEC